MTSLKKGNNLIQPVLNNNFGVNFIVPSAAPATRYLYPNEQGMIELKAGDTYPMVVVDTSTWQETEQQVTLSADVSVLASLSNYEEDDWFNSYTFATCKVWDGAYTATPSSVLDWATTPSVTSSVYNITGSMSGLKNLLNFEIPVLSGAATSAYRTLLVTLEFSDMPVGTWENTITQTCYGYTDAYVKGNVSGQAFICDAQDNVLGSGSVVTSIGGAYQRVYLYNLHNYPTATKLKLVLSSDNTSTYPTLLQSLGRTANSSVSYSNLIQMGNVKYGHFSNTDIPVFLYDMGGMPNLMEYSGYYQQQFPNSQLGTAHFIPNTNTLEYIELL